MSFALLLSCFIGALSLIVLFCLRYTSQHASFHGLGVGKIGLLKLCSSRCNWKALTFSSEDDGPYILNFHYFPLFLCHISGLSISFSWRNVRIDIQSITIYAHSCLIPYSAKSGRKQPSFISLIAKLLPCFELNCHKVCIYFATGPMKDITSIAAMRVSASEVVFSGESNCKLQIENLCVDQLVATGTSLLTLPAINVTSFDLKLSQFSLFASLTDSCDITLSVPFLLFLSSAIKDITKFDPDLVEARPLGNSSSSFLPLEAPILIYFSAPRIQVKLLLPETVADSNLFSQLLFVLTNIKGSTCVDPSSNLKYTAQVDSARLSAKYQANPSAFKHFCPIDSLLNRDSKHIAGNSVDLLQFDRLSLSNWTSNAASDNFRPISSELIQNLFYSILERNVLWNLDTTSIGNSEFKSDFSFQQNFASFDGRIPNSVAFYRKVQADSRRISAQFNAVEAFVPFEFPLSNLLDHSVVLFKAGWRPLSRKTERGYWSGDGDKFFGKDWMLCLKSKKVGIRFEDDQFDVRLSTIYHCQRKIAESRTRLEAGFWEHHWSETALVSSDEQSLADQLSVCKARVSPRAVRPLIELNKTLFQHYKEAIDSSRLTSEYNLLEATIDDFAANISWSPAYLQGESLANLLNAIENDHFINEETVKVLSTFLGGLFDVRTGQVQLSLRNFSRPVLLAPNSRLLGPLFLIEAPVRDPNVLVKLSVKVLVPNQASNLNISHNGTITVLRSILPIKLFHCIHISVSSSRLSQFSFSPYWMGCLGLVDRALDRFVKASTEDPSPPLPGWDKLRYNLRGAHSKISITSPLLVSCIVDSDPFVCAELVETVFPSGLDVALNAQGLIVLKYQQATLGIKSLHLQSLYTAVTELSSLNEWDSKCFSGAFANFDALPIIKLTRTQLQLRFDVKNQQGGSPCSHWSVSPIAKENLTGFIDMVSIKHIAIYFIVFRSTLILSENFVVRQSQFS